MISIGILIPSVISLIAIFVIFILKMKNENIKSIENIKVNGIKEDFETFQRRVDTDFKVMYSDIQELDKRTAVDKKEMEGKLENILIEFGTKLNSMQREIAQLSVTVKNYFGGKK